MKISSSKAFMFYYGAIAAVLFLHSDVVESRLTAGVVGIEKQQESRKIEDTTESDTNDVVKKGKKKAKKAKKAKKDKNPATQAPGMGGDGGSNRKGTIGLALGAGGFPAAVVAGGIMRGFQRKTILIDGEERPAMEGFDYTSAVSGGNLAQVLYAYAPGTTSDEILDAEGIGHPSEITKEELENVPESSMFSLFSESILAPLTHALFTAALFGDNFWESFIHKMFLEPFGISRFQPIGKIRDDVKATPHVTTSVVGPAELYPSYIFTMMDRKYGENLQGNTHKYKTSELPAFTVTDEEGNISFDSENMGGESFPYLQVNPYNKSAETYWELVALSSFQVPYMAHISPDEFAIPMEAHRATYEDADGNVTADYIDFLPVSVHPDEVQPQLFSHWKLPSTKFSLSKMLAVGTNLLEIAVAKIPDAIRPLALKVNYVELPTADGSKRNMALSDAGFNDVNAVKNLVQKGVRKLIFNVYPTRDRINDGLSDIIYNDLNLVSQHFGVNSFFTPDGHVFDLYSNNENQLLKLYSNLKSLYNAGEPLITTLKDLNVVENKFMGIKAGGKIDVTVIMNIGVPRKFSEQVSHDVAPPPKGKNFTDHHGWFTNPDLQDVPNLSVFQGNIELDLPAFNISGQTLPLPEAALPPKQARMTQILCSWMIEHAWEGLVGDDGEVKFEGFKKIFEEE